MHGKNNSIMNSNNGNPASLNVAETENDLQYVSELIYRVKEGIEGNNYQISDLLMGFFYELNPDYNPDDPSTHNEDME